MEIILAIMYFIFAGICGKCYKETGEDNCQFGMLIFALVGLLCLFFKFLW